MANDRAVAADVDPPLVGTVPLLGKTGYAEEMRGLVDRQFCFSQRYGEQQMRANRTGAQPEILDFEKLLIRRMFKLGVPMFGHCVVRTGKEQDRLFKLGMSRAKAGQSAHNYGAAVDAIHSVKAWNLTRNQWSIIGHVGKEAAAQAGLKVTWGGDWKFYDPAHWELTDWRALR